MNYCNSDVKRIWLSCNGKIRSECAKALLMHLFLRTPVWCQWSVLRPTPTLLLWCHDAFQSSLSKIYLVASPHCLSRLQLIQFFFLMLNMVSAIEAFPVGVLRGLKQMCAIIRMQPLRRVWIVLNIRCGFLHALFITLQAKIMGSWPGGSCRT